MSENKQVVAAVGASIYTINQHIKISVGFISKLGFYHGVLLDFNHGKEKKQQQLVFEPLEWKTLINYKEEICNCAKKRVRVLSHIIIPKKKKM